MRDRRVRGVLLAADASGCRSPNPITVECRPCNLLQLASSDNRSTKSTDGRVATEAAWLNVNNREKEELKMKNQKNKKREKMKGKA
jgi:hypothetical protein